MLGHLYRSVGTMVSLTGSSSDLHNYASLPASVQEALPPTPSSTPHMPSTPEPPRARVASLKTQNVREVRRRLFFLMSCLSVRLIASAHSPRFLTALQLVAAARVAVHSTQDVIHAAQARHRHQRLLRQPLAPLQREL